MSNFESNLTNYINAGFTYIYISSYEESRVANSIEKVIF